MRLNRLLKYINIAIGVALAAAVGVVYWYAWRPLPKTSGALRTFVTKKVTIARDRWGVPHITAGTLDDLLFAQGFATAQERMWQMEALRRLASGELAEIAGAAALESDREARNLRLRRLAEDAERAMPPADRAALAAYARGVNAYLESHRERLPLEFTLLDYQPRPWRVADSALLGLHMLRTLSTTWKEETLKRTMLAGGDAAKVGVLFAARSGSEQQPGSNAWAMAGKRTASGRPLVANDMHLEWSIPGIWYMVHLRGPGIHVAGVALPGMPGVIVGHNERIAWGITNLHFDVQDLYRERIDERGRYLYRGQVEQARAEREIILVRRAKPVEMTVWVTRHGPVLHRQLPLTTEEGRVQPVRLDPKERLALRWAPADSGQFQFPFLDINRAGNWQEFCAALRRLTGPASNLVYADVDGNIGYHAAGRLPIRKGYTGDVPVDGASGEFEWQGFIPFEELPQVFNPPGGLIVTANQNPFPPDYPYAVGGSFTAPYRARQIRELLETRRGWRAEEMVAVQKDVYSPFSHYLAQELAAACERRQATNPALAAALPLLRGWNGQMEKDLPQPLIVTLAYQHLRRAVADSAAPGKGTLYRTFMAPAVLENLLRARPAGWFKDWDEMLVRVFADAMEEGRRMQGPNVSRWRYGHYFELTIMHPIGHRLPLVASYFDLGPVPMSGSATTAKQSTQRIGPSMRMVADLGDWERSLANVPIGQSGHVLSRHYKDQWEAYYSGRSRPMAFRNPEAREVLELEPVVVP